MKRRAVLLLLLVACGTPRAERPDPDAPAQPPPSLAGRAVFVLPSQPGTLNSAPAGDEPVPGFDAALAAALAERAPRVRWIPATVVARAAQGSPMLRIRPRQLAVADFHRMRMLRVGEPLFTDLHGLGVLLDARYALLPWGVHYVPGNAGVEGRIEAGFAVIDTTDGDVLWSGVIAGTPAPEDDPESVASAARAAAERLSY